MEQQYLFGPRTSAMLASFGLRLISFVSLCIAFYFWFGQDYGSITHSHSQLVERKMLIVTYFVFSVFCSLMSDLPEEVHMKALSKQ